MVRRVSLPSSMNTGGTVLGPSNGRVARTLGAAILAISLPPVSRAALSIPSGYESFLNSIRRRVVCEEGDVFDPAGTWHSSVNRRSMEDELVRTPPQTCNSLRDGPFCRPLGSAGVGAHRPFIVDSLVSKHLFEDGFSSGAVESGKASPIVEQATHTMNLYMQHFASDRAAAQPDPSQAAVEGRLNLEDAPLDPTGLPIGYSKGLPEGLLASWGGSWQLAAGPTSQEGRNSSTALRLNSVVGYLRFSQPVVVRKLLMHPPAPQEDEEAEHRHALSRQALDSLKQKEEEVHERLAKAFELLSADREKAREANKKSLKLRKERARLFKLGEQNRDAWIAKALQDVEATLDEVDAAKADLEGSLIDRETQVKEDQGQLQQIMEKRLDIQDVLNSEQRRLRENLGPFRIVVRGRKDGVEVWRHMYDVEATKGPGKEVKLFGGQGHCAVGDIILGTWAGNNERFPAYVVADHGNVLTLSWLDNDHTHRLVPKRFCSTLERIECTAEPQSKRSRDGVEYSWRDMSRHTKAVDEIAILVHNGAPGWLLGELIVAMAPEPDLSSSDDETLLKQESTSKVVHVSPGPMAIIDEVSRAAVMYNVNEMLEQGLSLRPSPRVKAQTATGATADQTVVQSDSVNLTISTLRPPEGIVQFLSEVVSDTETATSLPPHVSSLVLLREFEGVLDLLEAYQKKVKRFVHFESYFSFTWDFLAQSDVLDVSYERWRQSPGVVASADGLFHKGQKWLGSYYCTQGATELGLVVKRVARVASGFEVTAVFIFGSSKSTSKEAVHGQYDVTGILEPEGRTLVLRPIPGSWKKKPTNFIMVGLQGIVSLNRETGELRYAGMIPVMGCDMFQLHELIEGKDRNSTKVQRTARPRSLRNESMEPKNVDEEASKAFRVAIMRYYELRKLWREELQRHLSSVEQETPKAKKPLDVVSHLFSSLQGQLMAAVQGSNPGVTVEKVGDHVVVNVQGKEGEGAAETVARALR